ncbi:hypothetical protein D5H75_36075 [Bailinhaonella thermotolerans]|uniref:Uncharacterized protein n=1 Tax=Bailinhaonella thermotolerans TaxID=1070861 RepID=A0A3A4A355_9ACTN|nr:hypothetical protein D5H75_36075 [Bailinhaonella thermotolerans]
MAMTASGAQTRARADPNFMPGSGWTATAIRAPRVTSARRTRASKSAGVASLFQMEPSLAVEERMRLAPFSG